MHTFLGLAKVPNLQSSLDFTLPVTYYNNILSIHGHIIIIIHDAKNIIHTSRPIYVMNAKEQWPW